MRDEVTWEMEAWGPTGLWSTHTFATEKEGRMAQTKLEKHYAEKKNLKGCGPYTFDLYRVERTVVPRFDTSARCAR